MNLNDTNLWMIIAFGVGFIANELAHHIERELEAKDKVTRIIRQERYIPEAELEIPMPKKKKKGTSLNRTSINGYRPTKETKSSKPPKCKSAETDD